MMGLLISDVQVNEVSMEAPAPAPDASPADAPAPDFASRVAYLETRNRELETRTAAAEAATPKLRDDAAYAPFLAAHDLSLIHI